MSARIGESSDLLKCSFCGKTQKQVKKLIAGPGVYICDECIDLCNEIIIDELIKKGFLASRCTNNDHAIKTTASYEELIEIISEQSTI